MSHHCCQSRQQIDFTVAEVFRRFHRAFLVEHGNSLNSEQRHLVRSILRCRTAEMGGHQYGCKHCDHVHFAWHSCNHRMCPTCGSGQTRKWVRKRIDNTLNVTHFMITFTLPAQLRVTAQNQPECFYPLFFGAASEAIKDILKDPRHAGIDSGFFGVLQTWQQNMLMHPHIHFVVPAIGIDQQGNIKKVAKNGWLVYGDVFAARFRSLLIKQLSDNQLINAKLAFKLRSIKFNCDVQNFGNALNAIKYLGAYLFKGAISNSRIITIDGHNVTFSIKDRKNNQSIPITLSGVEFIRRYLLHALPQGLHRIRYFGFMHPTAKKTFHKIEDHVGVFDNIEQYLNIIEMLQMQAPQPFKCPTCNKEMAWIGKTQRAPPNHDLVRRIYHYQYRKSA